MKTKINFSIDSKEITKQLGEALTAEAKQQARAVAQKKFAEELNRKTNEIIKVFDLELRNNNYSYCKSDSAFKQAIFDAVRTAIKETYTNNSATFNKAVEMKVQERLQKLETMTAEFMRDIDKKIKALVEQTVKNCFGDAIVKAIFEKNTGAK